MYDLSYYEKNTFKNARKILEILEAAFPEVIQKIEDDKQAAEEELENRHKSLYAMALSARTLNCLVSQGGSKEEYMALPDEELLKIRNFGQKSLAEFRKKSVLALKGKEDEVLRREEMHLPRRSR